MLKALSLSVILLLAAAGPVAADDMLYPVGYDIEVSYDLSQQNFSPDDTLTLLFSIVNNDNFALHNLHIDDNFPPQFELTGYALTLDGNLISCSLFGPTMSEVVAGYNSYRWVIDEPALDDSLNHIVGPGQTLILTCRVVCPDEGSYLLPFHSCCFYGDDQGHFSVADPLAVDVESEDLFGAISGTASDSEGLPIAGVHVGAIGTEFSDFTDGTGHYELAGLVPGIYDLSFSHADYADTVITGVLVTGDEITVVNITLYPAGPCDYLPGDINGDGLVVGGDISFGVQYFSGNVGPPPDSCWNDSTGSWLYAAADANGDCRFIGGDITFMVNYFGGGIAPRWCPQTPPGRYFIDTRPPISRNR
jgi:hypothetical protein